MRIEQNSYQFKNLVDVLNWIGESPNLWHRAFNCNGDDYMSNQELVELITNMLEQKHYTLLLVMLKLNQYSSGLDDILCKVVFKMLAENIQEENILEFGEKMLSNMEYRIKKEKTN